MMKDLHLKIKFLRTNMVLHMIDKINFSAAAHQKSL